MLSGIVHASVPGNTFAIYGAGEEKDLTELVPGILNQLGADSLNTLRQLAESLQTKQGGEGITGGEREADDDDDVPDLVENFDDDDPDLVENSEDAEKQD
jgi:nascent polypeptide-associated complex subunit beta